MHRQIPRLAAHPPAGGTIAIALAALLAACSVEPAQEKPVIETVGGGIHCESPPAQAGAVVLGEGEAGASRVRLAMGQRATGGYRVSVVEPAPYSVDQGIAVIRVEWRTPGAEEAVTQTLTRPCVEVEVPAAYAGARFVDQGGHVRGEVTLER